MELTEESYRIHEIEIPDSDHHINGVEIFFAAKASGKICLLFYAGIELTTAGTEKTKTSIPNFVWNFQFGFDQDLNRNLIAQNIQFPVGKSAIHCFLRDFPFMRIVTQ